MPLFDSYHEKHAYNFIASTMSDDLKDNNRIKAPDIVERFIHGNAWNFLRKSI